MITVKNISKSFNGTQVLKDISFGFEKGKTNLIIGKSGSGKSVLTKCIVGLFEPDEGEIFYDNRDFLALKSKEKKDLRKEMGMLFQGSALFDSLSVEENVAFPLRMFTNMLEDEILERVNFCLNRVNILNKNNLYPSELSGGMQKRVAIARAISLQPKYLFCDEPNSGLDPVTAIVIDELIKEITDEYKMTTIVITHDMNSVLEIGDNILFIDNGIKKWEGSKNEILNVKVQELHDFVYVSKFLQNIKPK
ncbi:ABC transporter ATP-binding protein [Flavobacteriales bacterium]|jgi:phospholipid/cholesterol/gamma-HCH transport system ATP-binding protein|nr:ABC transporter ATP-binding protein [Flavobacteriales bacterium]